MDKMTDSDQTIAMRRAKRIKKRNAAEKRFKWYGRLSIAFGMACVLFLFTDIVSKGIGAFTQTYINVDIEFNAESLSLSIDSTEEEIRSASFNSFFKKTLREQYPEAKSRKEKRQLYGLFSSDMPLILRDMVINNPNIIGTTQTVSMIADDDFDTFYKHTYGRDLSEEDRIGRLTEFQETILNKLVSSGAVEKRFNTTFFTSSDSREPCLLYTSPSPRDATLSRMPSSA